MTEFSRGLNLYNLIQRKMFEEGLTGVEILEMFHDDTGFKFEGMGTNEQIVDEMIDYLANA